MQNIQEFLKGDEEIIIKGSRVGFRSYSSDRFAIVGAAYDEAFYKQEYKALLWTKNKAQVLPQNIPNLYLNLAHGSRAFSTSVLAARYLCALINEEPLGCLKFYSLYTSCKIFDPQAKERDINFLAFINISLSFVYIFLLKFKF